MQRRRAAGSGGTRPGAQARSPLAACGERRPCSGASSRPERPDHSAAPTPWAGRHGRQAPDLRGHHGPDLPAQVHLRLRFRPPRPHPAPRRTRRPVTTETAPRRARRVREVRGRPGQFRFRPESRRMSGRFGASAAPQGRCLGSGLALRLAPQPWRPPRRPGSRGFPRWPR